MMNMLPNKTSAATDILFIISPFHIFAYAEALRVTSSRMNRSRNPGNGLFSSKRNGKAGIQRQPE
jgi:hypothetical protein